MKTNKKYISDIIKVHKHEYDYSLVNYTGVSNKVIIICNQHGKFTPNAGNFLSGSKCPKCSLISKSIKTRSNIDEFVEKCGKIHGDKYDYSLVDYMNNKTKVNIICKEHGIFKQRPNDHLSGNGCPSCHSIKLNTEEFIKRSNEVHNDKYNYSLTNYMNKFNKVKIICKEHGIFKQQPKFHLNNIGCPKCSKNYKLDIKEFIKRSNEVHNNLYGYNLVNYINSHVKVDIICKEHGIFSQKPHKHYTGNGCPSCRNSKGVIKISDILKENKILYEREVIVDGCVSVNNIHLRFDFYLPTKDIYIEYDGEQHFKPVESWGGDEGLNQVKSRDYMKNTFCKKNNIKLYRISYKDDIGKIMNNILKRF